MAPMSPATPSCPPAAAGPPRHAVPGGAGPRRAGSGSRTGAISSDLDLSQRLEVHGDDERAGLAYSFNAPLDALERWVEAQRHLGADASHELRTPLASL